MAEGRYAASLCGENVRCMARNDRFLAMMCAARQGMKSRTCQDIAYGIWNMTRGIRMELAQGSIQ